ncbi:DEAD/DEAH box helicase [Nanchangia anserum]|uniref:DEAD/DEAH box helicase n=1 Tax=Nanchangia anserum TaxID=2692125 RepID=A0A8I0KMX3_9ACTO|nr:DEAD/DEAH box helicase [Nanchangia anserum]MBD3688671.1 DEAD/DEAH box helicase [Nanchangia anserum]QOX82425.1 DEAD/DEAH box helicase [Nanchangia anserum]
MAASIDVVLRALSDDEIRAFLGPASYLRADRLVRAGALTRVSHAAEGVDGQVHDAATGVTYTVSLRAHGATLEELEARCTCALGPRCVHMLALILQVRDHAREAGIGWREHLGGLVTADTDRAPLGLGLDYADSREVTIYPLRRTRRGEWTRARVSWKDLASGWESVTGDLRSRHVTVMKGIVDLATSRNRAGEITLASLRDHALTQLLIAHSAGVALIDQVSGRQIRLAEASAHPVIDIRAEGDDLRADPAIRIGEQVLHRDEWIIGGTHALWLLRLNPPALHALTTTLTPAARRWWGRPDPVTIPAADIGEFALTLAPILTDDLPLTSTDRSWTPPEAADLVLEGYVTTLGESLGITWTCRKGDHRAAWNTYAGSDLLALTQDIADVYARTGIEDAASPLAYRWSPDDLPTLVGTLVPALASLDHVTVSVDPVLAGRVLTGTPHIAVTLSAGQRRDWLGLSARVNICGHDLALRDVILALSHGQSHLEVTPGVWVDITDPDLCAIAQALRGAADITDRPGADVSVTTYDAEVLAQLRDHSDTFEAPREFLDRLAHIERGPGTFEMPPAPGLTLRSYQQDGAAWCHWLFTCGLGGILADDMGLGKTVQVLTAIAADRLAHPDRGPVLVVAPTSVATTWISEAARFYPDLVVTRRDGTRATRADTVGDQAGGCDILVTSYHLLRLEIDDYAEISWGGCVLDEAQAVKNPASRTHRAIRRLDCAWRLAVSGTPVENSVMDLWAIYALVAPGLLPPRTRFIARYRRPIEADGNREAAEELKRRYRPFLCRRTKEQVAADLPAKSEQVVTLELGEGHRRIYDAYLARERQRMLGLIDDVDANRMGILRALTKLRLLSLDPALVDGVGQAESAKTDYLISRIGELRAAGHCALVFSQFTSYLARVRERLDAEGIAHAYLDGATRDREGEIARWRAGEAGVFLISIKAGGFGLTLTEADYVFVLDPWWNPAVEAQAVDRAHRIGQTRPVTVYRLLAADTVETQVAALAESKRQLYDRVIGQGGMASFDSAQLRDLIAASFGAGRPASL